jgi:hypothetical protein
MTQRRKISSEVSGDAKQGGGGYTIYEPAARNGRRSLFPHHDDLAIYPPLSGPRRPSPWCGISLSGSDRCLDNYRQVLLTFRIPSPTLQILIRRWPVGPNFISWTYNSGEPSLVNLQLLHKNNDTFQPIKDLLSSQGIFAPAININESMMLFTPAW